MLKWEKKDLIFNVDGNSGWMNSHAQVPTVLVLDDRLRVYFSTRETMSESRTTFIDLSIRDPSKILYIHETPILTTGSPGRFDEHGIMPSCVLKHEGKIYLYYSGWSRRTSVPYNNLSGLAISGDNGMTFEKVGNGPILSQNIHEPFSATSPFVHFENGKWFTFYCSGTQWVEIDGKPEHIYDIKSATSENGISWQQDGSSVISPSNSHEAITRPTILKKNNIYHMWYCYRGSRDFRDGSEAYRMGYASSHDMKTWTREDPKAGIDVSETGWDSKMIAYPYVIETEFGTYMFYNGNGFGKSGFGYAILEE